MKTTSRNLIATVLLAVTGSLVVGGEARALKCYLERRVLGPADLEALADKYHDKTAAEERNSMCFPGDREATAGIETLYGKKLRAEALADTSLLADLVHSMAEEGDEAAQGQAGGKAVTTGAGANSPNPTDDTSSVKMHKRPDNIGEEFDITKIMKLVEERKNCTSTRKPQKTCDKQPGPWLQHSYRQEAAPAPPASFPSSAGASQETPPNYQSRNKADRPFSSLAGNATESPGTGLSPASTTGAPYYQPNFNKNFSSVAKETLYRDEGLKSLLDAFIPLLRGKNFTALHKLEENLLQELQGSTQSSEASEKRLSERLLPPAFNRSPNTTRSGGGRTRSAVTARAGAGAGAAGAPLPTSQAVDEAEASSAEETRTPERPALGLGRQSPDKDYRRWEAAAETGRDAKTPKSDAPALKNGTRPVSGRDAKGFFSFLGHLWKKQAKGGNKGDGDKASETGRRNPDDRALENLSTRLRAELGPKPAPF